MSNPFLPELPPDARRYDGDLNVRLVQLLDALDDSMRAVGYVLTKITYNNQAGRTSIGLPLAIGTANGSPVAQVTITTASQGIAGGAGGQGALVINTGAGGQLENTLVFGVDDALPVAWTQALKPGSYFMGYWLQASAGDLRVGPQAAQVGGLIYCATASVSFNNTTTETTLLTGVLNIAASALRTAGSVLRFRLMGTISGLTAVGIRARAKYAGATLADTTNVASNLTLGTVRSILIEGEITCRLAGGGGLVIGQLFLSIDGNVTTLGSKTAGTTVVATNAPQVMDITFQFATANASNAITITNATVELLNA